MHKKILSLLLSSIIVMTSSLSVAAMEMEIEHGEGIEASYDATARKIPKDAVKFNGHYYYIYNNKTSFEDSVKFCKSLGGHMATISSQKENDFLFNYMISKGLTGVYFGYTDQEKEGEWKWVNGEKTTYTNWPKTEPGGGRWENVAMFYYGGAWGGTWGYAKGEWNDGSFNHKNNDSTFFCEWDPIAKSSIKEVAIEDVTYTGRTLTPLVIATGSKGKILKEGTNFTVSYSPVKVKNIGIYTATVKGKGSYGGSKKVVFKVNPAKPTLGSLSAASGEFKLTLRKDGAGADNYQIQYSTSSKFTKSDTKTVNVKKGTKSKTISMLGSNKTYHVRVRSYTKVGGKIFYSGWTTVKKVTTK